MASLGVMPGVAPVGATFYLEPVSTLDVDIFIELHTTPESPLVSPNPIFHYLHAIGCRMEGEHIVISGWAVQFVPSATSLAEEALHDAIEMDVEGISVSAFTAEYLAIALQTGPPKDKARLLGFVEAGALDRTKFELIVERHGLTDEWRRFQQQLLES